MMEEFLTPRETSKILRVSPEFVYKHAQSLGAIRIGRLVRFPRRVFEKIMEEVISGGGETWSDLEVRLHQERSALPERRISHERRGQRSGGKGENVSPADQYGLYRLVRESIEGFGDPED